MDLGLSGRVAVVAGGDSAAGSAIAERLRAEGADATAVPWRDVHWPSLDQGVDIVVLLPPELTPIAFDETTTDEELSAAWDPVLAAVDIYGAAVTGMRQRGWGRLVVLTTTATKSLRADADDREVVTGLGLLGLHKAVAAECGPDGIAANAVLRGGDVTDDEVADAVVFLASDVAGYVTGATLVVDGAASPSVF